MVPEYFPQVGHQICCKLILDHYKKYNRQPTSDIIKTELSSKALSDKIFKETMNFIEDLEYQEQDVDWLFDKTEEYCKERALDNALELAVEKSQTKDRGQIPDILTKALSVSFSSELGHDFFKDAEERFDYYHEPKNRIPFDIDILNKITNGGIMKKTMNCLMAGSGVGKSLVMCHFAAANLSMGYNVLYITLEMSEEWISKRIEANLFDLDINEIDNLEKDEYLSKIKMLRGKTTGNLIVHEYPTSSAHAGHFRFLLSELKMKKGFIPDFIYVDYLNICSSFKLQPNAGMYAYNKSIAEELRAIAVEYDAAIWTATQVNRDGLKATDFDMSDVSESMGIVHTLDIFLGLMTTDELEAMNLIKFKQLKNRYSPSNFFKSFCVGITRGMMKLFDAEDNAQSNVTKPANDKSNVTDEKSIKDKFKDAFG